jgi:hypothetical protein
VTEVRGEVRGEVRDFLLSISDMSHDPSNVTILHFDDIL